MSGKKGTNKQTKEERRNKWKKERKKERKKNKERKRERKKEKKNERKKEMSIYIYTLSIYTSVKMSHNCFDSDILLVLLKVTNDNHPLTHYQTTNSRLFQTERVCRQQFQIWRKWQKAIQTGRKQCGKRRNCSLLVSQGRQKVSLCGNGLTQLLAYLRRA